jgi:hypothetical protein
MVMRTAAHDRNHRTPMQTTRARGAGYIRLSNRRDPTLCGVGPANKVRTPLIQRVLHHLGTKESLT